MDGLIGNLQDIIQLPKPSELHYFAQKIYNFVNNFHNVMERKCGFNLVLKMSKAGKFEPSLMNYKYFHLIHLQVNSVPKPSEFEELGCEFEKVGHWLPNVIGAIHRVHLKIELTEERRF